MNKIQKLLEDNNKGWYVYSDDGEIADGPFDAVEQAESSKNKYYSDGNYKVDYGKETDKGYFVKL